MEQGPEQSSSSCFSFMKDCCGIAGDTTGYGQYDGSTLAGDPHLDGDTLDAGTSFNITAPGGYLPNPHGASAAHPMAGVGGGSPADAPSYPTSQSHARQPFKVSVINGFRLFVTTADTVDSQSATMELYTPFGVTANRVLKYLKEKQDERMNSIGTPETDATYSLQGSRQKRPDTVHLHVVGNADTAEADLLQFMRSESPTSDWEAPPHTMRRHTSHHWDLGA